MCDRLKELDRYSEPVRLNYDGGKVMMKSYMGLGMTILSFIAITAYFLTLVLTLVSKNRINVNQSTEFTYEMIDPASDP